MLRAVENENHFSSPCMDNTAADVLIDRDVSREKPLIEITGVAAGATGLRVQGRLYLKRDVSQDLRFDWFVDLCGEQPSWEGSYHYRDEESGEPWQNFETLLPCLAGAMEVQRMELR